MAKRYYSSKGGKFNGSTFPKDVVMTDYPKTPHGGSGYTYGDDLSSADRQMKDDIKFFNRKNKSGKW